MELIVTEKPSVARAIAEVVGATERQNASASFSFAFTEARVSGKQELIS